MLGVAGFFSAVALQAAETEYVEGDVIVTFKASATADTAKATLGKKSMGFTRRFGWLSEKRGRQTGLVRNRAKTTKQLIKELKEDPTVESAEPNYLRWINGNPNDTRFNDLWALNNSGQNVNGTTGTAGCDIKFPVAWDLSRSTTAEVVVGVIDTGVNYIHPDLKPNMWVNSAEAQAHNPDDDGNGYVDDYHGYDFVSDLSDPDDSDDHGTHVAGTIAAVGNNQSGVIGINSRAKVMALKVSTDGSSISTTATIEAIQYAVMMKNRGVNIVALNASYGGGGFTEAERAAIQAAGAAGIIMCAAAGNDSNNNDISPTYPANYRLPNMIVVAATDQNDALADFSNYGSTTVDIAAPGENILSTAPNTFAVQVGAASYALEPFTFSNLGPGFTGQVVDCGLGNPADFPTAISGKIALIERGVLTFAEKVTNAMAAGAAAVIVYNNVAGPFGGTLQTAGDWVPAGSISRADGLAIKAALPKTATMTMVGQYKYMDGTSMATPHVTGAVAFAAMNFPNETVAQRVQRIISSVDVKPSLTNKVISKGRLNLLRTVDANGDGLADWLERSGPNAPTITSPAVLAGGAVSSLYSQTLTATGGSIPHTWSVISGALPPGLTLSSAGVLEGLPTTPGVSRFALRVTDSAGGTSGQIFTVDVAAAPLQITTAASLPFGRIGINYDFTLAAIGGTPTYGWSVSDGALPLGFALTSTGRLTGTPNVLGTYSFEAELVDGGPTTVRRSFTLDIRPPPLVISTASSFAVGALDVPYSQTLLVTGGIGGHTWSVSEGTLPAGLSLSADGIISGTPTAYGAFPFTALVTDGTGDTGSKAYTLTVEQTAVSVTTPAALPAGVRALAYQQKFAAAGGSGLYTWSRTGGALPPGMALTSSGLLSGKPTLAGDFAFTLTATDSIGYVVSANFTLSITATYLTPIVDPITPVITTVGMAYNHTVKAKNYPKSFAIKNLPPGLKYVAATGVISGRPTTAGDFDVLITATNPAGTSAAVTLHIHVGSISPAFIGTFTGIVTRDASVNGNLGGRLNLTTTAKGSYTAKITVGGSTKSVIGYLFDTAPQIRGMDGNSSFNVSLENNGELVSGNNGAAAVIGWRSTWSATHPADAWAGYYTVGINLVDELDHGVAAIPQGSGFASFTVNTKGALTVTGKTADGTAFTSAGFIGPSGEIAIYRPLYGNLGSIIGTLTLAKDPNVLVVDNTASGTLTWLKPASKTRTYQDGFGPINLAVFGKYLALTSGKGIASGLPIGNSANIVFTSGGVEESDTVPDVSPFTYVAAKAVTLPQAGVTGNLGKATLTINAKTGLIGGAFTLVEVEPKLTRRVTFQGMVVRPASGDTKATGYFLLPQIPGPGEKITTSPILSGKVVIDQPAASE